MLKNILKTYESLDIVEKQAYLMTLHLVLVSEAAKSISQYLYSLSNRSFDISKYLEQKAQMAQDDLEGTMVSLKYMYGHYEDDPNSFNGR